MGWMVEAREALENGRSIEVRPRGHSMSGVVEDNQAVELAPVSPADVDVGNVVFVRWKASYLLHLVAAAQSDRLLIGNVRGKTNGWVERTAVLGRAVGVRAGPDQLPG